MIKQVSTTVKRWGVLWRDSEREVILFNDCKPLLFQTRREAVGAIEASYGWLRDRPDLRAAPHRWKMPKAVRVKVTIERV